MCIPEQELIRVINRVSSRLAAKYRFGYHSVEDMKQQAAIFALEGLDHYDGVRPLENFLWTHVRNRLYNYKRNNFERPDKPCFHCELYKEEVCSRFDDIMECDLYNGWLTRNTTKKNLMSTIDIDVVRDDKEQNMSQVDGQKNSESAEVMKIIEINIPVELREDFLRFKMNLKLRKVKRERLITLILEILKEHGIEPETW